MDGEELLPHVDGDVEEGDEGEGDDCEDCSRGDSLSSVVVCPPHAREVCSYAEEDYYRREEDCCPTECHCCHVSICLSWGLRSSCRGRRGVRRCS